MEKFLKVALLITANLMLVASSRNKTIFETAAVNHTLLPYLTSGLTIPETKWCGITPTAANDLDLGPNANLDMCCRTHYQCENKIEPFTSFNSLYNPTILPKYDCKCESDFFTCLQDVDDIQSLLVGQAYFGVLNQCFAMDYPIIKCVWYQTGKLGKRCYSYTFDDTKGMLWQFFDMPFYTTKA